MTSGTIFKIRSDLRDDILKNLNDLSENLLEHTYSSFTQGKHEIPLNLYFTKKHMKVSQGDRFVFFMENKVSLYQFKSDSVDYAKKSEKIEMWIFNNEQANNYVLVKHNLTNSIKFIKILNRLLFEKMDKKKSPFLYVNIKINNKMLDELHDKKIISTLGLMDVGKTDDSHIRGMKINAKTGKDLRETEEYKRVGEISETYDRVKFNAIPFRKKCAIHTKGYISSELLIEQYLALICFLIHNFEKVAMIDKNSFDDILI